MKSLSATSTHLREAFEEATETINACKRPVIIAGVEMHRFGLGDEVVKLAEKHQIPMCATLLGKSVVSERHPLYLGIYEGAMCRESVRKFVEDSDCIILLGTFMTDIDLGIYTAKLDIGKCIYVTSDMLQISHHHFDDVLLADFVKGLPKPNCRLRSGWIPPNCRREVSKFVLTTAGENDDEPSVCADQRAFSTNTWWSWTTWETACSRRPI